MYDTMSGVNARLKKEELVRKCGCIFSTEIDVLISHIEEEDEGNDGMRRCGVSIRRKLERDSLACPKDEHADARRQK